MIDKTAGIGVRLLVLEGDGIGKEISAATVAVLEAVGRIVNLLQI